MIDVIFGFFNFLFHFSIFSQTHTFLKYLAIINFIFPCKLYVIKYIEKIPVSAMYLCMLMISLMKKKEKSRYITMSYEILELLIDCFNFLESFHIFHSE